MYLSFVCLLSVYVRLMLGWIPPPVFSVSLCLGVPSAEPKAYMPRDDNLVLSILESGDLLHLDMDALLVLEDIRLPGEHGLGR